MTHGKKDGKDREGMLVAGLIVAGTGVLFLLINLDLVPHIGTMWPILPIIVGIALILGAFKKPGAKAATRPPEE